MRTITTRAELVALRRELGLREDWHEPDEQEVSATISGDRLDNADCSPTTSEYGVTITQHGEPVAFVNLATLLAIASGADAHRSSE